MEQPPSNYSYAKRAAELTCSEHNEDEQHELENEERSDDKVDGGHVDSTVDLRRTIGKVDVVAVDEVLQQYVQQPCHHIEYNVSLVLAAHIFVMDFVSATEHNTTLCLKKRLNFETV